jgi:hypothetical protein
MDLTIYRSSVEGHGGDIPGPLAKLCPPSSHLAQPLTAVGIL